MMSSAERAVGLFAAPNSQPVRPGEFRRSLAVVIGINDYANGIPRLTTAANDAQRLAQILGENYGYQVYLVDADGGKTRLRHLFEQQLPAEVEADDRLLVYFAGHGIALDGEDGPEGFLIPQDAEPDERNSFLPMTEVHEALIGLQCRHLLVILDCCFAGAFRWSSTRHLQLLPLDVLHQERYDRYIRDPAWQVLTSAAYDQRALDLLAGNTVGRRGVVESADGRQHSPFALALFSALSGAADLVPANGGDGVITATELYLYLRDYVELEAKAQAGHYQTPGIWPLRRHDKGEYIFLTPGHALNLPPAPELTAKNNPYRGLQPYDEEHAQLLFGRNELIGALAKRVEAQPLTVVLGASGTGKSSVVKAGLVPFLRSLSPTSVQAASLQPAVNGATSPQPPVSPGWQLLTPIRPGDAPLSALADRLALDLGDPAPVEPTNQAIEQRLQDWLAAHPQTRLLLVVDQFEELITLCHDDQERMCFLNLLFDLAQRSPAQMRIVLTLRTDFEPQFLSSPLAPLWPAGRFFVTPLTQTELRDVIEKPAAARVLFFDPPELVDQLIEEVIQTPAALPLLSFTLSELYLNYLKRQRQAQLDGVTIERSLTAADYHELGGVVGSLRTRANQLFDGLDGDHQATMRRIMLRMVALEGGELARRRVLWSELEFADPMENQRVQAVVDRLVDARLLVQGSIDFDHDDIPDRYVEPAHDALVRAWDRLLIWRQQAAEYLPLQRRLSQAAQEWTQSPAADKSGLLWDNDPGLPQVLPEIIQQAGVLGYWRNLVRSLRSLQLTRLPDWLNRSEREFIAASVQQRTAIRRRAVSITLGVFISLLALTIFAWVQTNIARRQLAVSQSTAHAAYARQAIQNNDYDLAIPLALAATEINDPPDLAINALAAAAYAPGTQRFLVGHTEDVTGVAFSPDGKLALTGSLDKSARLWDTATGAVVHLLEQPQIEAVTGVAFSPTGEQAALGLADGRVAVWDVKTGDLVNTLAGPSKGITEPVTALAYTPDGAQLLVGDRGGGLTLWDGGAGQQRLELAGHAGGVSALAVSADGQRALSGGRDDVMILWDLASGEELQRFEGHEGDVILVAFGPMPGYVLSGSRDYRVVAWEMASGKAVNGFDLMSEHTQSIGSIAVAPDYATVLSGSLDGSMILWDKPPLGAYIRSFVGHRAPVISLAYSKDGRYVLSGAWGGEVRLWDILGPAQLRRLTIEPPLINRQGIDPLHNLAIDEEHQRAFSGAARGLVLWDLQTGQVIHRFPAPANTLSAVALSPDGASALSAASNDMTLWNLTTYEGRALGPGHQDKVLTIAYLPDGRTALSASRDGLVIRWDLQTGEPVKSLDLTERAFWSVAFSVDGSQALTGAEDRSIVLWDLANGSEIRRFVGHSDAVYWVAFSPDGQTALSGSADRQVILWDVATGRPLRTFQGHSLPVHTVAYSPDGRTILSGGEDHSVRLWDVASGAEMFRFDGHSATVQNVLFLQKQPRILSRAADGTLILWQLPPTDATLRHLDLEALKVWTQENRYVRALTCDERTLYDVAPLC